MQALIASDKKRNSEQLARLKAFDRNTLRGMDAINYDVVLYSLPTTEVANQRYDYGNGGAGDPYILSQLGGAYSNIPDFLYSQHTIDVKADADAYLARLEAFATILDEEIDVWYGTILGARRRAAGFRAHAKCSRASRGCAACPSTRPCS